MMRVCVISDDGSFARSLAHALTGDEVEVNLATLDRVLEQPPGRIDVAVLDWRPSQSPDGQDIVELRTQIRGPVVVLMPEIREADLISALAAGARGVVMRESDAPTVEAAVRAVQDEGLFIDPVVGNALARLVALTARADDQTDLTPTELRVLQRFPRGLTNAAIAEEMGVSVNTIKTHVRHILSKLDCDNRVEAVQVARAEGLLQ